MEHSPLPSLLAGYGVAALSGVLAWTVLGVGTPMALLTFWLGGAALTLVVAAARRRPRTAAAIDEDADLAADLLRWERDREADVAEREARRQA